MHPLQNRNAEHTFARYCSKSPDYFHRNSVAQLFSGAGFSSPQQARAPDSCVPYSACPGQPCPAGGVAGSGGGVPPPGGGVGECREAEVPAGGGDGARTRSHLSALVWGGGCAAPDWRWVAAGRGCAAPASKGKRGRSGLLAPSARREAQLGSRRGRASRGDGSSGAFWSGGGERAAWEEELPGKGGAGVGARPEDEHWKFPELGSAVRARQRQERGAPGHPRSDPPASQLPGVAGRRRAPTWASGYTQVLREPPWGVGSGTKRERRVVFCLLWRSWEVLFPALASAPRYLKLCTCLGKQPCDQK